MADATETTKAYYVYRYELLRRKYSLENGYAVSNEELSAFLSLEHLERKPGWWQPHKTAVLFALRRDPDRNRFAIELLEPLVTGMGRCRKFAKRPRFSKHLPADVARKVVYQLQSDWGSSAGARKYSADAANTLMATILTGLLPREWTLAKIITRTNPDGSTARSLHTGQRPSHSSSHQVAVEVNLDAYSDDQLAVVTNAIAAFAQNTNRVEAFLRDLNRELKRCLHMLVRIGLIRPREAQISLRSAASQFSEERFSAALPFGLAAKMRNLPMR